MVRISLVIFSCLLFLLASGQSYEQPEPTLNTPYNTILNHLYYLQPDSYDPQKASITIPVKDSVRAARLAVQLKQIYDGQGYFIDLEQIPVQPAYYDSSHQQFRYSPLREEIPQVYVLRKNDIWQYSPETVAAIPELHRSLYPFGSDVLLNLFPKSAHHRFLGLAIWQYIGLAMLALILFGLHWIFSEVLRPLVLHLVQKRMHYLGVDKKDIRAVTRYISILLLLAVARFILPVIQLPVRASEWLMVSLRIVGTIIILALAFRCIDILRGRAKEITQRTESRLDEQLVPILSRILKVVVGIGGIIHILNLLDVNVTALIAGVSIGGLALALAAQDTVKNLIGSVMILFDRPFQIGDFVSGGDVEGTVVEVGFRSTRIQTMDTSVISVPNGRVADMSVRNFGVRTQRLMNETLTIEYGTSTKQIKEFINGLKHIVDIHPHTVKESRMVYLRALSDSSIDILFRCYMIVPDFATELRIKQELLFEIMGLAEQLNISWAFPSRTIYTQPVTATDPSPENAYEQWEKRIRLKYDRPDESFSISSGD